MFSSPLSSTKLDHWGGVGEAHAPSPVSLGKVGGFIEAERKKRGRTSAFSQAVMLKEHMSVGLSSLKGNT